MTKKQTQLTRRENAKAIARWEDEGGARRWKRITAYPQGYSWVLIAQKLPRGGAVWRDTHAAYVATVTRQVALHV
jgi:hypothetical protein